MKLGELLVRESTITRSALEEALSAQLVYGGTVGTCLIELGHMTERQLGAMLSRLFGIEYAPPEAFRDIPRYVIEALPARIAEKHDTVPLSLKDKRLTVAMVNPQNLAAVDELKFATGYSVEALVTAEVRIYQALERYYKVPRRLRYVRLCDQLDEAVVVHESGVERVERPMTSRMAGASPATATDTRAPAAAAAAATLEQPRPLPVTPREQEDPLAPLVELLCRVKDEAMLAQVVLDFLAPKLPRTILFRVYGGAAHVWESRGLEGGPKAEAGEFPITSEPLLRLLAGQQQYIGPVPGGEPYQAFFDRLGIRPPHDVVLAPAYLNDRLVALFYGDRGADMDLAPEQPNYRRLTDKLALALGLVDLKRRLRDT